MTRPAPRLYTAASLAGGGLVTLKDKEAHYLLHVLRLRVGEAVRLFDGATGEWQASVVQTEKHAIHLRVDMQTAPFRPSLPMTLCFSPPRGGRLETVLEKATELGVGRLQPVRTQRTVVDRINPEKAAATLREAAEQCERLDIPALAEFVTLPQLLGGWDASVPLIYGDESGTSPCAAFERAKPVRWAILVGPEGGFAPEEFALLARCPFARGVGLGPRILRVDTAAIALATLTAQAWGDWQTAPHFEE